MKIAILANGETVQQFTKTGAIKPRYDEVWGLNQQATWKGIELDKCFIMDDLKLRMPFYAGYDFVNWLKDYKKPIITSKAYDEWPTSEAYPIKEIAHYFGLPLGVAMYSTPDYMIALAIYLGATQIDLYGVDMSNKELPTESDRNGLGYDGMDCCRAGEGRLCTLIRRQYLPTHNQSGYCNGMRPLWLCGKTEDRRPCEHRLFPGMER
jgi:hypothetical protein